MPFPLAIAFFANLVLLATPRFVIGSIFSQSSVFRCNDHDDHLDCQEKLVVSLVVENDRLYDTEHLEVSVGCVEEDRCLASNMTIYLTKTPVSLLYSLSNPKMFNGRPFEEYVETGYGSGRSTCVDSEFRSDATCGWAANGDQDIVDSQGFCCKCPSFGGESIYRGFRDCSYSLSWVLDGTPSSAHCLRYDDNWWYRGYQIGNYQIDFEIQVHIRRNNNVTPAAETLGTTTPSGLKIVPYEDTYETLTLSPVQTVAISSQSDVVAELVGDFAAYAEVSSLRGHWLMIPVQPGLSPNEILSSNLDMWSIFEPALVSTTGECDKIGVSYTSFKYQTNACDRPFGACLDNQIFHFEVEDQSRMARGLGPIYNIQRYGGGAANVGQAHQRPHGLVLKLPAADMRNSAVTLSFKADDLTFVTNAGHAAIVDASMDEFVAIQESGRLFVSVNNTSNKPAMFHVSVSNCTADILPILQKGAAIEAGALRNFEFQVQARTDLAATNATCSVAVANAIGEVTDHRTVQFSMVATAYGPLPEQGRSDGTNLPGNPPQYKTCSTQCPNILSLKCSLLKRCWKRLLTGTVIIGSLLGAVYVVYACVPLIRRFRSDRGGGRRREPTPEPLSHIPVHTWVSNPSFCPGDSQGSRLEPPSNDIKKR